MRRLCGVALCTAEVISAAKQRHSHEILHWCDIIETSSIHLQSDFHCHSMYDCTSPIPSCPICMSLPFTSRPPLCRILSTPISCSRFNESFITPSYSPPFLFLLPSLFSPHSPFLPSLFVPQSLLTAGADVCGHGGEPSSVIQNRYMREITARKKRKVSHSFQLKWSRVLCWV